MLRLARRSSQRPTKTSRRGRPAIHDEEWIKVSVVLFSRQIRQLDGLTARMRKKQGARVTRSELIRASIDALTMSLDPTAARSEVEMQRMIAERLAHRAK